jgi:hypothetical protein
VDGTCNRPAISAALILDTDQFDTIDYLAQGNALQVQVFELLNRYAVMDILAAYQPLLVGTIPIDIAVKDSDLDIICCYDDAVQFEAHLTTSFGQYSSFHCYKTNINHEDTLVTTFIIAGWEVEIFGQNIPSKQQNGYRHMIAEYKLLQQYGEALRQHIISLKQQGLKTEPAFAKVLGIESDPYLALLNFY